MDGLLSKRYLFTTISENKPEWKVKIRRSMKTFHFQLAHFLPIRSAWSDFWNKFRPCWAWFLEYGCAIVIPSCIPLLFEMCFWLHAETNLTLGTSITCITLILFIRGWSADNGKRVEPVKKRLNHSTRDQTVVFPSSN